MKRRYVEKYMEVKKKSFRVQLEVLSDFATNIKKQIQQMWVAPAPLCAKRYISDPRNLSEAENRT